jgi:hypothetical protein
VPCPSPSEALRSRVAHAAGPAGVVCVELGAGWPELAGALGSVVTVTVVVDDGDDPGEPQPVTRAAAPTAAAASTRLGEAHLIGKRNKVMAGALPTRAASHSREWTATAPQ